jgi:hypothetical protein
VRRLFIFSKFEIQFYVYTIQPPYGPFTIPRYWHFYDAVRHHMKGLGQGKLELRYRLPAVASRQGGLVVGAEMKK